MNAQDTIHTVIKESSTNILSFNVMPGKPVEEKLFIKEYRIGLKYIEGIFDRSYHSTMKASPSHLIFLSVLVHWQKLVYVYFCHHFGLEYNPQGREIIKIWPTKINIKLPKLETDESNIVQKFWIQELKEINKGRYKIIGKSIVNSIEMSGETIIIPTPED